MSNQETLSPLAPSPIEVVLGIHATLLLVMAVILAVGLLRSKFTLGPSVGLLVLATLFPLMGPAYAFLVLASQRERLSRSFVGRPVRAG